MATEPNAEQLFDQALNQIDGQETPVDPIVPEVPEAPKEEPPAPAEVVEADPLANLPEDVRQGIEKRFGEFEAKVKAAESEKQRHIQQVAGYEKNLKEARAALDAAARTGSAAQKQQAQAAVTAANGALAKMKEEYPSLAASIETIVKESSESIRRDLQAKFDAEVAKVRESVNPVLQSHAQSLEQQEMAAIESRHPGWLDTLQSSEFKGWWEQQPAGVKKLAEGGATEEIALFDLFRSAHPVAEQQDTTATATTAAAPSAADLLATKRAQQLKDAAGPSGKRTPSASTSVDANDPERLFDSAVKKVAQEFHVA